MEGEGNYGVPSFNKTGRDVGGNCTCGDVSMGSPVYECMVHRSVGVISEVKSGAVSSPVGVRPHVLQHPVLTNTCRQRPDSTGIRVAGLGKRKKRAGDYATWTSMFKRACVQDMSSKVGRAPDGSCSLTHSTDSAFVPSVATLAVREKDVSAPVNTEASRVDRSRPANSLAGEYSGPLMLDFTEGKAIPLAGNGGVSEQLQNLEGLSALPDYTPLDDERIGSYNSRKRLLQFDSCGMPSGKKRAVPFFQHDAEGVPSVLYQLPTQGDSVDGFRPSLVGVSTEEARSGSCSRDVMYPSVMATDISPSLASVIEQRRINSVQGNPSQLSDVAGGNSNSRSGRPSGLPAPTSHLKPRRGGRNSRMNTDRSYRLPHDYGLATAVGSDPMLGLPGTSSSSENVDRRSYQSVDENIGTCSIQATTVQRPASRSRSRRGGRTTRTNTSRNRQASQNQRGAPPSYSNPSQSVPGTSTGSQDATRRGARAGPPSDYNQFGPCSCICRFCHAKFWYEERLSTSTQRGGPLYSHCCRGGTVKLFSPREYPQYIKDLYADPHFMNNIRAYNQMFSMTSLGATIDDSVNMGRGPYVFKVSGQIYHCIGRLCKVLYTKPIP